VIATSAEFQVYSRYLGVSGPTTAMARYYEEAAFGLAPHPGDPFDARLVRFASVGPVWTALADAYARRVRPYGCLRQRLVLALAILESAPPSHRDMHRVRRASLPWTLALLGLTGARAAALTVVAAVVLGPMHAIDAVASGRQA
jgi:hypothetical protein